MAEPSHTIKALVAALLLAIAITGGVEARLFYYLPVRETKSFQPGMVIAGMFLFAFCWWITRG